MSSFQIVIPVHVRSWLSLCGSYLDSLSWCHSVHLLAPTMIILNLLCWPYSVVKLQPFGISLVTVSVVMFAHILHGSDLSHLSALSSTFGGLWMSIVYYMGILFQIAGCDRWLASSCTCCIMCRCACYQLIICTYHHPLSPLVDASVGVLAITSLSAPMVILVLQSCTPGTVCGCGTGCWDYGMVIMHLVKGVALPVTNLGLLCGKY